MLFEKEVKILSGEDIDGQYLDDFIDNLKQIRKSIPKNQRNTTFLVLEGHNVGITVVTAKEN